MRYLRGDRARNGSSHRRTFCRSGRGGGAGPDTRVSPVIVKYENGNEQAENLTEFAFANARNRPETFRRGLTEKINEGLDTHGVAANNRGE